MKNLNIPSFKWFYEFYNKNLIFQVIKHSLLRKESKIIKTDTENHLIQISDLQKCSIFLYQAKALWPSSRKI